MMLLVNILHGSFYIWIALQKKIMPCQILYELIQLCEFIVKKVSEKIVCLT